MGREEDGYPVYQENFLRQGIKEFPFPESQLFKMLVTNFSHCKVIFQNSKQKILKNISLSELW